jgi:hypothetical protein
MNFDLEKHMKKIGAKLLRTHDVKFKEVISVDTCVIYGGYCETCEYTTAGIIVRYRSTNNAIHAKEFEMQLSELMRMKV